MLFGAGCLVKLCFGAGGEDEVVVLFFGYCARGVLDGDMVRVGVEAGGAGLGVREAEGFCKVFEGYAGVGDGSASRCGAYEEGCEAEFRRRVVEGALEGGLFSCVVVESGEEGDSGKSSSYDRDSGFFVRPLSCHGWL